jgi:DNA-binding response OmpR family regulator
MEEQNTPVGKKILLIEDELQINELYKHILEGSGHIVTSVYDGEAGVQAASDIPDLILLDIMLPKKNGMTVLQELKSQEKTKGIPVVLLTNLGQSDVIKTAFDMGAQGYFLKMRLTPSQLLEVVKNFLINPAYSMEFSSLDLD